MNMNDKQREVQQEITSIVGEENFIHDEHAIGEYLEHSSFGKTARFSLVGVAYPGSEDEVVLLVKLADTHKLHIVPVGAGIGLKGKPFEQKDIVMIGSRRLDRIVEIDKNNLMVTLQPGIAITTMQQALEEENLYFPAEPGNLEGATIGGAVAVNADSIRSLKYGVVGDYVMGLRMVTATGEIFATGRKAIKDVAGYNLAKFIVGSRGRLGIITELLLKTLPLPKSRVIIAASFSTIKDAMDAVTELFARNIVPSMLEFLDNTTLDAVNDYQPIEKIDVKETTVLLLVECDGHNAAVEEDTRAVKDACDRSNAASVDSAADPGQVDSIIAIRKAAIPALGQLHKATAVYEIAIPRPELPALVDNAREVANNHNASAAVLGHAGGGTVNVVFLLDESTSQDIQTLASLKNEMVAKIQEQGGRISRAYCMGVQNPESLIPPYSEQELQIAQQIKHAFDPEGLFKF